MPTAAGPASHYTGFLGVANDTRQITHARAVFLPDVQPSSTGREISVSKTDLVSGQSTPAPSTAGENTCRPSAIRMRALTLAHLFYADDHRQLVKSTLRSVPLPRFRRKTTAQSPCDFGFPAFDVLGGFRKAQQRERLCTHRCRRACRGF